MTTKQRLRLPKLISDRMVLQRNEKIKLWGYGKPGTSVNIFFMDLLFQTTVDSNGKWTVYMEGLRAGGPYELTVSSEDQTITIQDVLIGDVWLASGQSNMELPISRVYDTYREELCKVDCPFIRQFKVVENYNFNGPLEDVKEGGWTSATKDDIQNFSAAAYFFAKSLYERYSVPIGILNATKGGSPVEAWLSEEALQEFPHHVETLEQYKEETFRQAVGKQNEENMNGWYHMVYSEDVGLSGENPWYANSFDDSDWSVMTLPGDFKDYGVEGFTGVIWLRKEFNVPASMAGKKAKLWLGTIIDADDTYINGVKVGDTGYQYPPRKYDVPSDLLKEGVNQISVRVICDYGKGRFTKDKVYRLFIDKDSSKPLKVLTHPSSKREPEPDGFDEEVGIDLTGEWKYKISLKTGPKPDYTFIEWKPCGLYNAMVAPLQNYTIKGAIWYQGESNVGREEEYQESFAALIKEWRKKWGLGDFPFLFVQLVNFLDGSEGHKWARLRVAQSKTLKVNNTAMVVAHDLGEWNDLHPQNKKDIGYRLSLAARKLAYGEDVVYSGPMVKDVERRKNRIYITFEHVGSGLVVQGGNSLGKFEIKDEKGEFVEANASIEMNQVVVGVDCVVHPTSVRYAWEDAPMKANLYNKEGLPASCFQIDLQD